MLTILQIGKTQEFFHYEGLHGEMTDKVTIVTPNPSTADLVRKNFTKTMHQVESITISKFIKEELNSLFEKDILLNFRGKSELSLLLAAIWKKIGRGSDVVGFQKAFNLLTELRSFSMSEQVFETVLEHYDEYTAEGVLWMHKVLEQMDIIDEHKSYFQLSEKLRAPEFPVDKAVERRIVFYGFDYMTASQVDLIKSLALRDEVFIPVYKSAYEKAGHSDWIKWFDSHNLCELDLSSGLKVNLSLRYETFSKGAFSSCLAQERDANYIVLGTKKLTPEFVQEVPLTDLAFKTDVDLFSEALNQIFNLTKTFLEGPVSISEMRAFLLEHTEKFKESGQFRALKCTLTFLVKLNDWENLSEDNIDFGDFEFEILKEATRLDSPRISMTSLMRKHENFVKSLSELEDIKGQKVILGINSLHQSVKGINANYSEGVEKYLSSLGPIRRAEFEVSMFKERFGEFIEDNEVTLLIESGILEHDMNWSQILGGYELEHNSLGPTKTDGAKRIDFSQRKNYELETISASKLQRFYDCPMKFYYSYVDKTLPRIDYPDEVSVLELGSIEHKTIETYCKKFDLLNEKDHSEMITYYLNQSTKEKNISSELWQEYFVEIKAYTERAIKKIFELKESLNLELTFEFPFEQIKNDITYRGSIDCYMHNKEIGIVIDFKRSGGSFTSFSSILNFDQLQLWFYLKRLKEMKVIKEEQEVIFGYMNLSDIENSMFFVNEKESLLSWKKDFEFKKVHLVANLEEVDSAYIELEEELIDKLKSEKLFKPNPRKAQTCSYCHLSNICPRSSYGDS